MFYNFNNYDIFLSFGNFIGNFLKFSSKCNFAYKKLFNCYLKTQITLAYLKLGGSNYLHENILQFKKFFKYSLSRCLA